MKALGENIIQLWAELGTPQAQQDGMIVKYYRDAPEQLGLHEDDVARLRSKRDKLADEKRSREKRLRELRETVEGLWERLGVKDHERKRFLNGNRGCGVRQINEFEDELQRLHELKRQNLHLFVEDARYKLQELWDGLYFSEEEMLEFTPAFSDVYSDALLEAHEQEINRLQALKEQRAPTLALIDKHRSLVKDRDDLQASSQDASRLLGRGQKGEKRDPTRLLREEKMRKRIAKDLPKIAIELRKVLENWEDEYGRPFLVHGERYLDELEASEPKIMPGPRSKTPAGPSIASQMGKSVSGRSNSVKAPSRSGAKTPTIARAESVRRQPMSESTRVKSPSKIPSRAPLSNIKYGQNSPERHPYDQSTIRGNMGPPPRAPPPKMRDLFGPPLAATPATPQYRDSEISLGSVRHISPEDNFYDGNHPQHTRSQSYHELKASMRMTEREYPPPAAPSRQISNTSSHATNSSYGTHSSHATTVSGSENWQTIEDDSEPERDATEAYHAKLRAAQGKIYTPEIEYGTLKKQKNVVQYSNRPDLEAANPRIISGSEANWTDEDGY